MTEDEAEQAVWDAAKKRLEDPEWNRNWFDNVMPQLLRAAEEHWASLTPTEREEFVQRRGTT